MRLPDFGWSGIAVSHDGARVIYAHTDRRDANIGGLAVARYERKPPRLAGSQRVLTTKDTKDTKQKYCTTINAESAEFAELTSVLCVQRVLRSTSWSTRQEGATYSSRNAVIGSIRVARSAGR